MAPGQYPSRFPACSPPAHHSEEPPAEIMCCSECCKPRGRVLHVPPGSFDQREKQDCAGQGQLTKPLIPLPQTHSVLSPLLRAVCGGGAGQETDRLLLGPGPDLATWWSGSGPYTKPSISILHVSKCEMNKIVLEPPDNSPESCEFLFRWIHSCL